jgi:type I restriction enzyme S subunit
MQRLVNLTTKIGSGATPRGGKNAYKGGDFSLIRSQNILDFSFSYDGLVKINNEQANALSNVEVQIGDVLLNITGDSVARCCQVDPACLPARVNQHVCIIRPNPQLLDSTFLKYFLLETNQKQNLLILASAGATRNALTKVMVEELEIPDFDVCQQKAIAHILSTLDDKIELNQKMNQTLEEIAKAIFKSWFVDFDPVCAKAEGRPTGLPPEISDLFPDELVDSDIGEIPKGWELTTLGDHTALTKGRSYKSAELMDSDTALVTLKSFHRGGGYRLDGLKPYTGTFKPEQVVEEGDLIIALTDVTQAADVIGKPAIVRSSTSHSQLVASLDVGIVRLKENSFFTKEFCYFLMLSNRYTHHSLGYTSGTTVLHLAKDASAKFQVSAPPIMLIENFTDLASNLMRRIFVSEKEIEVLSELRDTLLPKLISGELGIPDAERFLAEAGI